MTVIPKPSAILATRVPMLPSPYRPKGLSAQFAADEAGLDVGPGARPGGGGRGDDLAGQCEGQGEDVFGDGLAVLSGGDGDPHPVLGGGGDVDVVAADTVPGDDLQFR